LQTDSIIHIHLDNYFITVHSLIFIS